VVGEILVRNERNLKRIDQDFFSNLKDYFDMLGKILNEIEGEMKESNSFLLGNTKFLLG